MKVSDFEQRSPSKTIVMSLGKGQLLDCLEMPAHTHACRKETMELLGNFGRAMKDESSTRDQQEHVCNLGKIV